MSIPTGCEHCRKSSLSLLLLRPSPVPIAKQFGGHNTRSVESDPSLTEGLLPTRLPTQSRFVLRLLRPGYVHVYFPQLPTSLKKNWLTFRVTDDADLIHEDRELFRQVQARSACIDPNHNRAGLKVLTIPNAHSISECWIAFSANLWSTALRTKNAANPAVMQKVALAGGSPNTFTPTITSLRTRVLECGLRHSAVFGGTQPTFRYHELSRDHGTEQMALYLMIAADGHRATRGKELAVVLADPVGIAAELNQQRVIQYDLMKRELKKPEYEHPFRSASAVTGLRKALFHNNKEAAQFIVCPKLTKEEFNKRPWPPGAKWFELSAESKKMLPKKAIVLHHSGALVYHEDPDAKKMGIVKYADHEALVRQWAEARTEKQWEEFSPYFDHVVRDKWFTDFRKYFRTTHEIPLDRQELDWTTTSTDKKTIDYFVHHFDEFDTNNPANFHSPGAAFAHENSP